MAESDLFVVLAIYYMREVRLQLLLWFFYLTEYGTSLFYLLVLLKRTAKLNYGYSELQFSGAYHLPLSISAFRFGFLIVGTNERTIR